MKISIKNKVLTVSDITDLGAIKAAKFKGFVFIVRDGQEITQIDIDLSQLPYINSAGLEALFAIYRNMYKREEEVLLRLLYPRPAVDTLFRLVQFHHLFEIVPAKQVPQLVQPSHI